MAKAYIHEIGDKLSSGATAANLPTHIKEIAPIMYNDGSNNFSSIQAALNGKAASSHNHDSRYYTESEVDTKLNGKAASSHNHGNITSDGKMDNPDNMTCPLVVSADGTICRAYFGSRANTVAEGNHTHGLTFSTSSGNPDYKLNEGDIIAVSAGGTTKKIQIAPDFTNTLEDPFIPPAVLGSMWRNAETGDIWIAKGDSSVKDWILVHNRIHDLIVQRQTVVVSGHGDSRPILCDKQDYTMSAITGIPVYARVSPYDIAKWKNRGDVIQFGGEVDTDPWGDGYPMRMTEYQAAKDANDKWYCTNINLRGYKYNPNTEGSYWGNLNHDDSSGEDFIEFQSW